MIEAKKIKDLIFKLNKYTEAYDRGEPEISDKEWDQLYFELQKLEEEYGIIYPNSPTQSVHFEKVSELKKVTHNHLMLSLAKTKDPEEIVKFLYADIKDDDIKVHDWCAMFKMDGLTASLTYEDGKLVRAETRGNGIEGEDILHNVQVMSSIPKQIPAFGTIVVDGEIICTLPNFEEFKTEYANPRNFAAGSIRLLNSKEFAARKLKFVAWDLIQGEDDIDFFFWRLEKLDDWGFITVPRVGDAESVQDAIDILDRLEEHKIYPIDGYVFRFESQKYYNSLGRTDHHFRGAQAFKFFDEEYETELLNIEWGLGRTGVLTPVAIFKPVYTGDSVIERASLHNVSVMKETLGEYPELYQKIWVEKMNMVIPQITRAEKNDSPHDHILQTAYINYCPVCGHSLEMKKSDSGVLNLMCTNPACEGLLSNRIEHFCSKKGLDIKGISKATIERLIDWGWVKKIEDIYYLHAHQMEWISQPGWGKTSVFKILDAIDESRENTSLFAFISAIGIPLVGITIAKEIVKYYISWEEFRAAVGEDWTEFDGFGPEISKSINTFDYTEVDKLVKLFTFKPIEEVTVKENNNIKDKVFVITGKLANYASRDLLKSEIESLGGKVSSAISSKTNYLISNDKDSTTSKTKKAKELGVEIITEDEYLKMKE